MSVESLKERLPDYARDLKLNLSSIATEPGLTEQQRWGAMLASALASREATVITAITHEASQHLSPEAMTAAKTAASIMAMNNIYYRFLHLVSQPDYKTMPARLRMNALSKPGVDKADFELWSLAVSAINGCGMCLEAHEHEVRKAGLGTAAIQNAVRIAAVIHAVSVTLENEAATAV
jgi:alkyl hydroperoxide reductase subunit D